MTGKNKSRFDRTGTLWIFVAVTVVALVLAACGPQAENTKTRALIGNGGRGTAADGTAAPANSSGLKEDTSKLVIFHAGSLSLPFKRLAEKYEKKYPGTSVEREASGSRIAARKVSELGRSADIVATADYSVIQNLLMPEYADWFICFARNEMVIAFTEHSRYANEINKDNWFEILLRKDVRFGHSDPDKDPCGYRTRLVWKLADLYYKKKINGKSIYESLVKACPVEHIRPAEIELTPMLQAMALDYIFQYRSLAEQHNLRYLRLPERINLTNPKYADTYRKATIKVSGKKPGSPPVIQVGTPIVYGFTIPKCAKHLLAARRFADMLLGEEGMSVLSQEHQNVIKGGRAGFLPTSRPTLDR